MATSILAPSQHDAPLTPATQSNSLYLSTDELPERDRLAIWHEVHGRTLFNLGMRPHADSPFRADAKICRVDDVAVTTEHSSRAQYYVDRSYLHNAQDSLSIFTVLSGKVHGSQNGRDALIGPGESFAILNSDVASVTVLEEGRSLIVYVPRHLINYMVPNIERSLMQPAALDRNALKLLVCYANMLQESAHTLDIAIRHSIAVHLGDLTASVLGTHHEGAELASGRGLRTARLHAIKEDVMTHLADHDLSTESVAARLGITSRYVRKLLDSDGTSFSDLVLRLRLLRAHRLLCDPRQQANPIGVIAYDAGFGDLSYFNRTFRRQFGMTPRDTRAESVRHRVS